MNSQSGIHEVSREQPAVSVSVFSESFHSSILISPPFLTHNNSNNNFIIKYTKHFLATVKHTQTRQSTGLFSKSQSMSLKNVSTLKSFYGENLSRIDNFNLQIYPFLSTIFKLLTIYVSHSHS